MENKLGKILITPIENGYLVQIQHQNKDGSLTPVKNHYAQDYHAVSELIIDLI